MMLEEYLWRGSPGKAASLRSGVDTTIHSLLHDSDMRDLVALQGLWALGAPPRKVSLSFPTLCTGRAMFSAVRLRSPALTRSFTMSTARSSARPVSLLTPKQVHDLVQSDDKSTVVIDASWHMPAAQRQPFQEYRKKRIEGATFWDVYVPFPLGRCNSRNLTEPLIACLTLPIDRVATRSPRNRMSASRVSRPSQSRATRVAAMPQPAVCKPTR